MNDQHIITFNAERYDVNLTHSFFYIYNFISQELHKITYHIKLSDRWPSRDWNNSIANALEPPQPHT